jgi:hypothetical protein
MWLRLYIQSRSPRDTADQTAVSAYNTVGSTIGCVSDDRRRAGSLISDGFQGEIPQSISVKFAHLCTLEDFRATISVAGHCGQST